MRTIVTVLVFVALAQSQPSFDVATIKVNKSDSRQVNLNLQPGGRFVATNVSLQVLISVAYGDGGPLSQNRLVINAQWVGGGDYLASDHFDIEAKADGDLAQDQLPQALQGLLADRFKLVVQSRHQRAARVMTLSWTAAIGASARGWKRSRTSIVPIRVSSRRRMRTGRPSAVSAACLAARRGARRSRTSRVSSAARRPIIVLSRTVLGSKALLNLSWSGRRRWPSQLMRRPGRPSILTDRHSLLQ